MNKLLVLSVLGALLLIDFTMAEEDKRWMTIQCYECSYFEFGDNAIGDESCSEDKKPNSKFLTECKTKATSSKELYPYCIKTTLASDSIRIETRDPQELPGNGSALTKAVIRSCGHIENLPVVSEDACVDTNAKNLTFGTPKYLQATLPHPNFLDFVPSNGDSTQIKLKSCFCQGDKCNPAGNIQVPVLSVLSLFGLLVAALPLIR